jgi:hypothetical protein
VYIANIAGIDGASDTAWPATEARAGATGEVAAVIGSVLMARPLRAWWSGDRFVRVLARGRQGNHVERSGVKRVSSM